MGPRLIPEFRKEEKPTFVLELKRKALSMRIQNTKTRIELDNRIVLPLARNAFLGQFLVLPHIW
jgi:hypothetical protein